MFIQMLKATVGLDEANPDKQDKRQALSGRGMAAEINPVKVCRHKYCWLSAID